jgi:YVTN family beta-propeller protein
MGGTARIQTASPDGSRLYTLYTTKDENGRHAFIHVLDLENLWAHCIDLPDEFADMAESSTALAVAPDGKHLYASNTLSGSVVEIDTGTMHVEREATFNFDSRGQAHAMVDDAGTLFVASGPWVVAIDTADLTETDRWAMEDEVKGLQGTADPASLYVGLKDRVKTLDTGDGTTTNLALPGIRRIGRLGPVLQPVVEEPILKCAC